MPKIIDSHIHLNAADYKDILAELLDEARAAGVEKFICIGAGYGIESAITAVELAEKYDFIYASVGIHPQQADRQHLAEIEKLLNHKKVVAVGETGLDYHYVNAPVEEQKYVFIKQIELARAVKKPLIIHSRNAGNDCLQILNDHNAKDAGGVFHCYGEDAEFAKKLKQINFMVSFPGVITFKNAESMRTAARDIPLEQIMIETDGPFLAPQSFRGKLCRPVYITETLNKLAEVKGLSTEEASQAVYNNTLKFFGI